jgi:hypothetical protein
MFENVRIEPEIAPSGWSQMAKKTSSVGKLLVEPGESNNMADIAATSSHGKSDMRAAILASIASVRARTSSTRAVGDRSRTGVVFTRAA